MKKTSKINSILCILMFIIVFLISVAVYTKTNMFFIRKDKIDEKQWYNMNRLVVHALGKIDGITYTNSKEALENSYRNGERFLECDFSITADGQIVACHDWNFWLRWKNNSKNTTIEYIPDFNEFMNTPVKGHNVALDDAPLEGNYTALSGEELILFMKEHPDLYIITDTKDSIEDTLGIPFLALVELAKENECEEVLQRFIVQIYHESMYEIVKNIYPFHNYIFTLYQEDFNGEEDKMEEYAKFCRLHNIDVITMWADRFHDSLLDVAEQYNIQIFVHTVNDKNEIEKFLRKNVGVYTDENCLSEQYRLYFNESLKKDKHKT